MNLARMARLEVGMVVAATLLVVAVFMEYSSTTASPRPFVTISAAEAKQLIDSTPNVLVLDVRTVEEFDGGHIAGAINIPLQELQERLDELDKGRDVLVYCRSGTRSAQASQILVDNGFTEVYNMGGGINAWKSEGFPVVGPMCVKPSASEASETPVAILA